MGTSASPAIMPNTDATMPTACESQLPTLGKALATQSPAERSAALSRTGPEVSATGLTAGSVFVLAVIVLAVITGTALVSVTVATATASSGFADFCGRYLRSNSGGCENHCSVLV